MRLARWTVPALSLAAGGWLASGCPARPSGSEAAAPDAAGEPPFASPSAAEPAAVVSVPSWCAAGAPEEGPAETLVEWLVARCAAGSKREGARSRVATDRGGRAVPLAAGPLRCLRAIAVVPEGSAARGPRVRLFDGDGPHVGSLGGGRFAVSEAAVCSERPVLSVEATLPGDVWVEVWAAAPRE